MRDVGLVGAPFSGKSTLFTALTHAGSHGGQANVAVVPVPDPRLQVLTQMERSRKTVAAQVRFGDVPGGLSSAQGVAKLREADALAIVVRCFGADASPLAELASVRGELLLADMAVIEGSLQKAEKKAKGKPGPEVEALRAAKAALDAETPLRDAALDPEHLAELKGIAPLTLKPEVVVANLEEGTSVPAELGAGRVGVYAAI
jgi:ribosome-binding ATPase YchF (GTP1/OBG family)